MMQEYVYYDVLTIKYIKKKEFKIINTYLYVRQKKDGFPNLNQHRPLYENKLINYDLKIEYISLYDVIFQQIEKGMTLDEIYIYLFKNYKKISYQNILYVYLDGFELDNDNYNFFIGPKKYYINFIEKKRIFNEKLKSINYVADSSINLIDSLIKKTKLTSSVVVISKKKLTFSFETDILSIYIFFNSIYLSKSLPYKQLKDHEISIFPEIANIGNLIYKNKYDIVLLMKLETKTKYNEINIDFLMSSNTNQKLLTVELDSDLNSKKIIKKIQKNIPFLKKIKTVGTGDYSGSFNLYGFDFNHILLSYAIMNIEPFNQLLYINETDSDPFVIFKKRSQYHMNSIGTFFDTEISDQFTKNESIIRFSMTNEKHNTSAFIQIPDGEKVVIKAPPTYQHVVVNFSHGSTIKSVYILREYLIRLFGLYIKKEKDIRDIYMSYGIKYNIGTIITDPEEEVKEIRKYRQFDYYHKQSYTKTCGRSKRPKIINKTTYEQLLLSKKDDSLMILKNKQNKDVYMYCPYEKQPKIVFESGRPCCYNSRYDSKYKNKVKKTEISTKKYTIKHSKILDYLKLVPISGNLITKVCDSNSEIECIQKILKIKNSSKNETIDLIERLYKINIVVIELGTGSNNIKIKNRSKAIHLKYKSIILIKHGISTILNVKKYTYYEYITLMKGKNSYVKLNTDFTEKLNSLYKYEYNSELVEYSPNSNVFLVNDLDYKLNYHQIVSSIPTNQKNQIIDSTGKLRCIILKKSNIVDENIYMCTLPIETDDISGQIVKIEDPVFPDYDVVYNFFEYYPISISLDQYGSVIGFWYYHKGIYNSFYCPIKPILTSKIYKKITYTDFLSNVHTYPLYIFSKSKRSIIDRNYNLKKQTQNILTLVSYLYSLSGFESSNDFKKYLEIKIVNKDSNIIYDLSYILRHPDNLALPHKRTLDIMIEKMDFYENIVPSLIKNRKILCYSPKMKQGIMYYLNNYQQNKNIFESNLMFIQKKHKKEIKFDTFDKLKLWFSSKNKYKVYDSLRKYTEIMNPIIYIHRNNSDKKNKYYLIQKVKDDSFERCIYVSNKWRTEKINNGYNSPEYVFSSDERGRLEIPYHVILRLNSVDKIIFGKENQKNILMILAYSGKRFAAVLPL